MTEKQWVPLLDFALRNGISPSTVRRKIKAGKIEFRLEGGKYLIHSKGEEL